MRRPHPTRSGGRRAVRLALWALALVAVLTVGRAPSAGASPLAPVQRLAGEAVDPCVDDAARAVGEWDCLPFYRWAGDADYFHSNFGRTDPQHLMQPVVSLLFGTAGLLWRLLQWLTRTALSFDLFTAADDGTSTPVALQPLNDGFAAIGRVVLSGLGIAVLVAAVVFVVVRSLRVGGVGARDLVRPFLCLGLLLFLLARSQPLPGAGTQAGSPAWVAERAVGMSNLVGDQISAAAPRPSEGDTPDNLLDCTYYVRQLRQSFDDRAGGDMVGTVAFQPQLAAQMSGLWEAAYLDLWIEAQFGRDRTLARRTYCRLLEDRVGVPPADQAALTSAALAAAGGAEAPPGLEGTAPFGRFNGDKDFRRGMVAWAVCGWYADRSTLKEEVDQQLVAGSGPGFAVNPEFRLMWNLGSPPSEQAHQTCSAWWGVDGSGTTKPPPRGTKWAVADGDGPFQFGTMADIDEAFTVFGPDELDAELAGLGDIAPYEEADRENLPDARRWVVALNGHNLVHSIPHGILAVVIAGVYLWAIGGLALGTLVAQFLTIFFFVALPLLLVVGMWPSPGAGRVFQRCCRIGVGSLFAKAVFVALLAVLMTLISVINALADATGAFLNADGGTGFGGVLIRAAAPIVAIWALRWALKDLGMGNIFSLQGAVGLTGRLARGTDAAGDSSRAGDWASRRWEERRTQRAFERRGRAAERRNLRGVGGPMGARRAGAGPAGARPVGGRLGSAAVHGARFAAAPVVGGVALARWAARRVGEHRAGPEVDPGAGRAPAAEGLAPHTVADAYAEHARRVVAAGNAADPVGARHHPDLRAHRGGITRVVGDDGRVCSHGPSGVSYPATPGWGREAGDPFGVTRGWFGAGDGPARPEHRARRRRTVVGHR